MADFIVQSEISVCLLFKKSVSGRKAFLKSVGLWNETSDTISSCTDPSLDDVSTKFVLSIPKVAID